jgi:hypothetical protein
VLLLAASAVMALLLLGLFVASFYLVLLVPLLAALGIAGMARSADNRA